MGKIYHYNNQKKIDTNILVFEKSDFKIGRLSWVSGAFLNGLDVNYTMNIKC